MSREGWLLFLGLAQIELKRRIMTLDTLSNEDQFRLGPPLWSLSPEEREAEISRRHARNGAPGRKSEGEHPDA